jgi:hypothetical protein
MRAIATAALILGCSTLCTVAWARNDCGPRGDEPCPEKGRRGSEGGHEESSPSESSGGEGWMNFELKGPHPFVGIGLNVGAEMPFLADRSRKGDVGGQFAFALRGGLYTGLNRIAVELSPMTYLIGASNGATLGPSFAVAFHYTGFIPLHETPTFGVYWPMGVGFGAIAGNIPTNAAFMNLRIDLIGLAFRIGHVMLDFSLPSFRYIYAPGTSNGNTMFFSWLPGVNAEYVF